MDAQQLASTIRTVPDWPKPGIQFKDITTLLADPEAFRWTVDQLAEHYADAPINKILGIESRGFIFGAALAYKLGLPFVLVRKKGKLPAATLALEYELEYGTDCIEIHQDQVGAGDQVLIVDDLLATGGTAGATCQLVRSSGATVHACAFLIELSFLPGRSKLGECAVFSLIDFGAE